MRAACLIDHDHIHSLRNASSVSRMKFNSLAYNMATVQVGRVKHIELYSSREGQMVLGLKGSLAAFPGHGAGGSPDARCSPMGVRQGVGFQIAVWVCEVVRLNPPLPLPPAAESGVGA